jgi:hypothetical protein
MQLIRSFDRIKKNENRQTCKENMKKLLLIGLLSCLFSICNSQTIKDPCDLMVRVVNNSKYHIEKLVINDSIIIDSLASGEKSDFKCLRSIYTTLKYDIIFTKKRLIGRALRFQIISYSVDHVGEKKITEGQFELFLTIDNGEKDKYEIYFDRRIINTGNSIKKADI